MYKTGGRYIKWIFRIPFNIEMLVLIDKLVHVTIHKWLSTPCLQTSTHTYTLHTGKHENTEQRHIMLGAVSIHVCCLIVVGISILDLRQSDLYKGNPMFVNMFFLYWKKALVPAGKASYCVAQQGPELLTLKSYYLKAFSRKHGCDWLMLKHQPITATLSAKSF